MKKKKEGLSFLIIVTREQRGEDNSLPRFTYSVLNSGADGGRCSSFCLHPTNQGAPEEGHDEEGRGGVSSLITVTKCKDDV